LTLTAKSLGYVTGLSSVRPNRRTGSAGNREATRFFAETIAQWDYTTDTTPFPSVDYRMGESWIEAGGRRFALHTGPYSLPVETGAPLLVVRSIDELKGLDPAVTRGAVLLLRGEVCSEQLMPKNFPFYNPEHHQRIYQLLERAAPAAIIAATGSAPEQVGALNPYPLIVDGDFDIPNTYCTEEVGGAIEEACAGTDSHSGACVIEIDGERSESESWNVIAQKNPGAPEKIVITAHIDAYEDTPGALDNAAGTATLLLIAELLSDYAGSATVEIAAWNGEDHYSVGGQKDYLARYGSEMERVRLVMNIDDIGYVNGSTAYSFYECPSETESAARGVFAGYPGLKPGEPWWSGDHMVMVQAGKPAIAFTADRIEELMRTVTHTERDTPELVDPARLLEVAEAVATLVRRIAS
jgi:aminopeptidase YwaD